MKKLLFIGLFLSPIWAFTQAVLPTAWNFSTPGVANPPAGWSYSLGTGNLTYATGVGDNISLRLDQGGEFLQIQFAEKPGTISYYIRGTGIAPNPPFTGSFTVQESVDGANWTTVRNFTSMNTSLTRNQDNLLAGSRYVRFFYTSKQLGSNVQLDSVMISLPPPPPQSIVLFNSGNKLVNGGNFVFGNAAMQKFIVQNAGVLQSLKIDSIVLTGPHAADFSVQLVDSIAPANNGLDSFVVNFNAGAAGSRFATLNIYNTDPEKNPFVLNMYAIGGNLATEPANQVARVNISNLLTHTMNVSFPRATGAEKYMLLRKPAASLIERPVDGITYRRGDYIGEAQVAYIGNDSALIKPNYILANTTYTFVALAFNGPDGFENYNIGSAASASVTTGNGAPGTYYAAINPNSSTFVTDLSNRLKSPHDTIFYSNYAPTLVNNYLTRDTTAGKKVVDCVYTGIKHVYDEPFIWWNGTNSGTLTREHTFAQSWMPLNPVLGGGWPEINGREVLEYNDLHNLFPAHQLNANSKRSNNPFGVVANATYTSPTGVGKLGTDAGGKTVYEPKDDQKGDVARALFYMLLRYEGDRSYAWRLPANQDIAVLLQWHNQDPPSALEIARNEYIASIQKNRNPFIDNPIWVNWINFTNLTYIPQPTSLVLTAPNGGEIIAPGSVTSISWTSSNIDSVKIELLIKDTLHSLVAKAVAASQSPYNWNVPANLFTDSAKIRISSTANNRADTSNGYFAIKATIGFDELQAQAHVLVYPNPANGLVYITSDDVVQKLSVYDVAGKLIYATAPHAKTIEVSLGEKGLFFLHIQTEKGMVHKRILNH
jgi:hypothetical protein